MSNEVKEYLGDGVYMNCDGFNIILTTEDGVSTTNTIYLEPNMLKTLVAYATKIGMVK